MFKIGRENLQESVLHCYGLPVHLPYIVITCARIDSIKRVCSEPPCCPGAFLDLLSIHDIHAFLCTTKEVHLPKFIFQPRLNLNAITGGFSACLTGLKFLARFHKLGWKFEIQPRLKLSSCNRKRLFKKICSGSRAEISPRVTRLKFVM